MFQADEMVLQNNATTLLLNLNGDRFFFFFLAFASSKHPRAAH